MTWHSLASLGGPTPAALQAATLNWYSVPSMSFRAVYSNPFTAGLVTGPRLTRPQYTAPRSLFSNQYPWMVEPPLSRGGSQVMVMVVAVAETILGLRGGPGRPYGSFSCTFSDSPGSLTPYLFSALIANWKQPFKSSLETCRCKTYLFNNHCNEVFFKSLVSKASTHSESPVNQIDGKNFIIRFLLAGISTLHNIVGNLTAPIVLWGIPGQVA